MPLHYGSVGASPPAVDLLELASRAVDLLEHDTVL